MADKAAKPNALYYGDNLEILRDYIADASVDLIYLDPPFNSNADYNVLFAEQDGSRSAAQIKAFGDTWRWDQGAAAAYVEVVERGGRASQAMQAFRQLLGENAMLAYLAMMAPRLIELRRVLKPTGSIYLHCDSTASHYLKVLMDSIFGPRAFRSQIIWKRTSSHGNVTTNYGDVTDILLYYSRDDNPTWNQVYIPYSEKHIETQFTHVDEDGRRYTLSDLRNPSVRPNLTYEYKGYKPHPNGWAVSREKMEEYDRQGRLWFPPNPDGRIRLKRYLDESSGHRVQNLWDNIPPISSQARERLGYPTQKPEALLERIITASSNEGDVVLDPFCGCGTAVAAAHKLNRRWIGIDITHLAIGLMRHRLRDTFGDLITTQYAVYREPQALPDAHTLAEEDKFQFQAWALGLVGARTEQVAKKGADHGIDGRLYFHDVPGGGTKQVIFSVKGGHTDVKDVRDLGHVVSREGAQIGVLITLQEPTRPMRTEAADGQCYESPWGKHPRLQILTIAELLDGKQVDMPPIRQVNTTFKKAPKATHEAPGAMELPWGASHDAKAEAQ